MTIQKLDFGSFQIYPNMIIGEMYPGVHIDKDKNQLILDLIRSNFPGNTPFGYISNRTFNYSIDPMVHHINREFLDLKCFALVDPNGIKPMAAIESKFFNKEYFQTFHSLDDAIEWVKSFLSSTP
ncbi:hypothetical protein [Nonlabens antarcticus]|uniref:hypothetical protein n=1 Tax=Nonlabens antarcticus TaxID=392714 RepID=UPI001890F853|nr:hypothetical protein [Nonlabens antarcticus]